VTLRLRLIDEPAAEAIVAGRCPPGWRCAPDYPAEGDRVAAGMFLERCRAGVDPRPFGAFLVTVSPGPPPGPEVVIGGIGFHGGPDEQGRVEIGYGIAPSYRGKGHATEALRRLVVVAERLGATTLIAETEVINVPSQTILRRVGFTQYAQDAHTFFFERALGRR
jgi:RimJ/RimL family protein N-acetyltransferase